MEEIMCDRSQFCDGNILLKRCRELGVEETPTERNKLDHKAVVAARKLVSSLDNQVKLF